MRKSSFGDFLIFVVSGQEKCAVLISIIHYFLGYPEITKYLLNKSCLSCLSHKIVGKLAYLGVKMMSHNQKDKIIMKVASIGVSKLRIWLKDIKSPGKLPILV